MSWEEDVVLLLLRRETDMDKCGSFLVLDARKTLAGVCLLLLFRLTGGVVFSFTVGGAVMVERRVGRFDTDGGALWCEGLPETSLVPWCTGC